MSVMQDSPGERRRALQARRNAVAVFAVAGGQMASTWRTCARPICSAQASGPRGQLDAQLHGGEQSRRVEHTP